MVRTRRARDVERTGAGELDELVAAEERLRARREHAHAEAERVIDEARAAAQRAEELAERELEQELARLPEKIDAWRRREEDELAARGRELRERYDRVSGDALAELAALVLDATLRAEEPTA